MTNGCSGFGLRHSFVIRISTFDIPERSEGMGIPTAERGLVRGILQLLALRGIPAWRNNSGAMRTPAGGFLRFGVVGGADVLGVLPPAGRLLAVEAKVAGGRPTEAQVVWLANARRAGAVAIWVNDLTDLECVLGALDEDPFARFSIEGIRISEG